MKYTLSLAIKDPPNTTGELDTKRELSIEKIESDDLLQLVSQFNMMVLTIQRQIHEDAIRNLRNSIESDIPF